MFVLCFSPLCWRYLSFSGRLSVTGRVIYSHIPCWFSAWGKFLNTRGRYKSLSWTFSPFSHRTIYFILKTWSNLDLYFWFKQEARKTKTNNIKLSPDPRVIKSYSLCHKAYNTFGILFKSINTLWHFLPVQTGSWIL